MILAFGAMTAEAAAASAALATAASAAAPIAASTTAAGLTAAGTAAAGAGASALPGIVAGATPELAAAAAPAAEGIAAGAQAMSPEIAANMTQAAAQNAGQAVNPAIQGGANPALTQAGPAPQIPQGIDQGLNVQSGVDPTITNNMPNGGFDAYGQFTQAPGSIDPAAANQVAAPKPYVNGPPSGMPGSPVDPNAGLLKGVDYAEMPGVDFAHAGTKAPTSGLQKGFESALKFTKDNPLATSLGIQAAGALLNSGSGGGAPPKKTATRKDMSGFNTSSPSTVGYNPIYQPTPYAEGGIASYAVGGPVEQMSAQNAVGNNTMYPQSQLQTPMYSNPMVQRPMPSNVISSGIDAPVDPYSGEQRFAEGGATGSGSLDLHVPIDLGASGIAQGGGAGGYSAGGGQTSTLSTATGAPSQTAQQPPAAMAPAATAEPLNIQPRGNVYVPKVQWGEGQGMMRGLGSPTYTVGDSAADAYVKNNAGSNLNLHDPQTKARIESLYQKYYRGYAKGGTTKSEPNYAEMMGIRSAAQQKADEEYLQSYAKKEMAGSINTDSDIETAKQDPMHASMTRLKKIGKRVGIKPVELPKSDVKDSNVFHAANGGIMHNLGGYSDGGRLLKGPGDGVSDSIPATIGNRQPARLADGEFVVPARIVSELGNGSTEAGARKLYQMMERVQADRKKSIGKGKVAVNSKATKHLPK
jgi:hypothetical protein